MKVGRGAGWFESDLSRSGLLGRAAWGTLWLGTTVVGLWLRPDAHGHGTHRQLGLPPCPSALLFDRPCPGCGMTTSWTALLHGELALAFSAHPLGPPTYVGFTLTGLVAWYGVFTRRRLRHSRDLDRLVVWSGVIFFAFGLARMTLVKGYSSGTETSYVREQIEK